MVNLHSVSKSAYWGGWREQEDFFVCYIYILLNNGWEKLKVILKPYLRIARAILGSTRAYLYGSLGSLKWKSGAGKILKHQEGPVFLFARTEPVLCMFVKEQYYRG